MNKKVGVALATGLPALGVLAEGSSVTVDLSEAASAASAIQTSVTGLFSGSVNPMIIAICTSVFIASILIVLFRWGRKPVGR